MNYVPTVLYVVACVAIYGSYAIILITVFVCTQREIKYMDPNNIEFPEEPHNRISSVDHRVEYADVAGSTKNTNV